MRRGDPVLDVRSLAVAARLERLGVQARSLSGGEHALRRSSGGANG
ncbi:MAG: hypothetical protein ACYDAD_10620 [Acidimicrobiales bacterium]